MSLIFAIVAIKYVIIVIRQDFQWTNVSLVPQETGVENLWFSFQHCT